MGSWVKNLVRVALGVACGLALAELLFRFRDHGAFPRLNVYEADEVLAVRLRRGATERVSFNGNPVSRVRINSQGFRDDEPQPAASSDILVVGDSQVFGLGVDEDERFTSLMAPEFPGRHIQNAGVPTYGPLEFLEVTRRLLSSRHASTVVYVVNLANDLFEAARPNRDRHAVLDGWALRRESVPDNVTTFPGRELLFRDSHALFAYRAWRHHEPGDPTVASEGGQAFASEGTWKDLIGQAATEQAHWSDKQQATDELDRLKQAEVRAAVDREAAAAILAKQTEDARGDLLRAADILSSAEGREYERTHGHPLDISVPVYLEAEAGPSTRVVGTRLIKGAEVRKEVEEALATRAAALKVEEARKLLASDDDRPAIQAKIDALQEKLKTMLESLSPVHQPLSKEVALCKSEGASLVVLVLPLDVQVSPEEWAKYGESPIDMRVSEVLIDDIVRSGAALGVPVWSALPALRAAEPGAFLAGDIHMTPKGHRAVAEGFSRFLHSLPAPEAR